MPTHAGPNITSESNLVFAIDTHDTSNGITPLGCGGFNGSNQGVKNLLNGVIYPFVNGMTLSARNYFTAIAIDYPEGSYGGDAAYRQGITPGYDVRSGGKLYDASRALHLWVYNNDTNSWIDNEATTYFRGARLGGHCYDNYSGAETGYLYEIGLFISDYNTIKATFPNCTYIIMGSHRADRYTSDLRTILYDLGMPTGTALDSDYVAAPEWILIGKPGLQPGNAFGWVYENYTTNSSQVAHMNFGLPIKARGGMIFDGTNDYLTVSNPSNYSLGTSNFSLEFVFNKAAAGASNGMLVEARGDSLVGMFLYVNMSGANTVLALNHNSSQQWQTFGTYGAYQPNTNYHIVVTVNRSANQASHYVNGNLIQTITISHSNTITPSGGHRYNIGQDLGGSPYYGNISIHKLYNKALTALEVQQNYNQYKTRFNLS